MILNFEFIFYLYLCYLETWSLSEDRACAKGYWYNPVHCKILVYVDSVS